MTTVAGDRDECVIELPERLDFAACETLAKTIGEHRGKDLRMTGRSVRFLGALAAEILLRAHKEWQSSERCFELRDASLDMLCGFQRLGIPPETFAAEAAT